MAETVTSEPVGPLVLAEQERVAQELTRTFAGLPADDLLLSPADAFEAVEAPGINAFAAAACMAGIFENVKIQSLRHAISSQSRTSRYGLFSVNMLHSLNLQPQLRTRRLADIAVILDVSQIMVGKVVSEKGIQARFYSGRYGEPLFTKPDHVRIGGWYDLDQIENIREGMSQFNAPEGYIAQSAILGTLGIAPVAFVDICQRLEVEGRPFHNPELGRGEYFFKSGDTLRILEFVRNARRRQRS